MIRPQLEKFISQIGKDSIAIIPAAREVTRSHDTEFKFHQNPDFYYLTGFPEPDAVAVIAPGDEQPYKLFVRPRDPEMETWNGRRFGVEGAEKEFGAHKAFDIAEFTKELPNLLNGKEKLYYRLGSVEELDKTILKIFKDFRVRGRKGFYAPSIVVDPATLLHEARLIKTPQEIELMQRAADIAAAAHVEAMKAVRPGMNEYEIEALIEYVFRKRGASGVAYNSIVAGGNNACILHYTENNAPLNDGELLLIDAGANFQGYASDITRTFPINGKFAPAQRDIYGLVLSVEEACIKETRTGVTVEERQKKSIELLTEGMLSLGILQGKAEEIIEKEEYKKYYMHGVGHYLGMDVHDAGRYYVDTLGKQSRPMEPGMVLTVEPGIYIPLDATDAPEKYRGIGVRIEDDVLVTENGQQILTSKVPKDAEAIEELMNNGKK